MNFTQIIAFLQGNPDSASPGSVLKHFKCSSLHRRITTVMNSKRKARLKADSLKSPIGIDNIVPLFLL